MRICGIDENGLGPLLGPLIITAYESEETSNEKIKDSKILFSRKPSDYEKIEKFFLENFDPAPQNLKALFEISEFKKEIEKICPAFPDLFCFSEIKIPCWTEKKEKHKTEDRPKIRFAIICPYLLYLKVKELGSKFSANAYFMSKMALFSSTQIIICGKSGFKKSYKKEIQEAVKDTGMNSKIFVEKETNEISSYIVEVGSISKEISFVKDADTKFHTVARASVIGKYIRELCMMSITKFILPDEKYPFSGYGKKSRKFADMLSEKVSDLINKEIRNCIERNY